MSLARHDWLPLGALDHASVRAPIEAAVAAWSEHWFARRRVAAVAVQALDVGDPQARRDATDGGGWRGLRNGLTLSLSRRASARLVGWALDADLEVLAPAGLDRRIVEAFEKTLIDDLLARVAAAAGLASAAGELAPAAGPFAAPGGLVVGLADQGAPWFWLGVPFATALGLRRSALSPSRPPTAPLSSRAAATASTPLRLEARLADVEMTLADLSTLAVGDVLVLDQLADSPAQLRLAGGGLVAHGLLTALDGHAALTLHS